MKADKTKEIIAFSLFNLLKTYSFEEITVNMICEESGVGRSTFYRFFRDKYDLLLAFFEINYQKIEERFPEASDYQSLITGYLSLIQEYRPFFRQALKLSGQNSLAEYITDSAKEYYIHHVEEGIGNKVSEDTRLSIILFTYGFLSLVNDWVMGQFEATPDQLAKIALDSLPEGIKPYFEP